MTYLSCFAITLWTPFSMQSYDVRPQLQVPVALVLIVAQVFWKTFRIFIENGYSRNSVPQFLALYVLAFVIRCTEKGYKAITSHR